MYNFLRRTSFRMVWGPLVVKHFQIFTALLLVFLYFLHTTTAKKAKEHNAWHKAAAGTARVTQSLHKEGLGLGCFPIGSCLFASQNVLNPEAAHNILNLSRVVVLS